MFVGMKWLFTSTSLWRIPRAFSLAVAVVLLVASGCKPKQDIVRSYDYLIKKDNLPKDSTVVTKPPPLPSNASAVERALREADSYLGTPYRHGGINKNGIDCSGLAQNSYAAAGVSIPRSTIDQVVAGVEVPRSALQLGDLVFFDARNSGKVDHVGIIVKIEGPAQTFIHASTSKGVRYDRLDEGYWKDLFLTARRVAVK
jgi:probable lipoprotein NlpC